MTWLFFSLLTALSVAARDVYVKICSSDFTPANIGAAELFWSLPLLITATLFVPPPLLDSTFWWAFIISLPLNWAAYLLYLYAIKLSPVSLSVPFLSFTPVFMIVTGFLILDEAVSLVGITGIIFIVLGSYLLNMDGKKPGILRPLTRIKEEKGSWMMLIVAFIYSFAAVVGKQGMIHSSPLFFTFTFFIAFNISLLGGLLFFRKTTAQSIWINRKKGMILGPLLFTHVCCHALAISVSTAAYMIAVKRSSIIFTLLLSRLFLKESSFKNRFLGTLAMFFGVLLITVWG